jgi:hypothetical protein
MQPRLKPSRAGFDAAGFKITFLDQVPLNDVEAFFQTNFFEFGEVQRDDNPRILHLANIRVPYDLVVAQLSSLQSNDGVLIWEEYP